MDGKDQVLDTAGGLMKRVMDQETELNQAHGREKLAEHGETVLEKRWMLERTLTEKMLDELKEIEALTENIPTSNATAFEVGCQIANAARAVIAEAEAHLKETP